MITILIAALALLLRALTGSNVPIFIVVGMLLYGAICYEMNWYRIRKKKARAIYDQERD